MNLKGKLKLERPIVFADIESTGVDRENDRIVELSLIKIGVDGSVIIKTQRMNPLIPIPKGASDVHGITDEDVKDLPPFFKYAKSILGFIEDCDLAGFNSNAFDFPMLYTEFLRCNIDWDYSKHSFVDVGNIFKKMFPRTLSEAVKFFLGREHDGAHGAEKDTIATAEIFVKMLRHEEVPKTIKELSLYSNYDKKMLDLHGKFVYDEDGETILINFGKHKGEVALNHPGFLEWMITKATFTPDVNRIVDTLLSKLK